MKTQKKGFSIIYVFFLITLILSFGAIVVNKQNYFEKNIEYSFFNDILSKNIVKLANTSISNLKQENQSGGLYIPVISCPETVELWSGSTFISSGSTQADGTTCSGILNNHLLNLSYTSNYLTFGSGTLESTGFTLSGISFLTGSIGNQEIRFSLPTTYDNRFIQSRMKNTGIISPGGFQSIFWNNDEIKNFILSNTNNTPAFLFLSELSSGVLFFNVNNAFSGKIIEFDKNLYNTQKKLLKKDEFLFSSSTGVVGYLQSDGTFSSSFGTPKMFDFSNKDYGVFLSYNSGVLNNLRYTFQVFSSGGTGVYINPIKDDTHFIEYLGNNIIENNGLFLHKIYKIKQYK